jgi:glycosyltransferase involved in cell wall biosynthesis
MAGRDINREAGTSVTRIGGSSTPPAAPASSSLRGRRAAVLLFSYYPSDSRPRRAAEALASEGMRVELICLRTSHTEPARETFKGVDILRLPLKRHRGGPAAYLFQYSAFILSTFALLAVRSLTRRYALVHVHNMPDLLVFSALVPKMLGAKVVLDLHDPMPELMMTIFRLGPASLPVRLLKRFERWSICLADAVFTVNLACKKIFEARSCRLGKIQVVMNSPDEEFFALRGPQPRSTDRALPFVMMYHGSILERNGLDVAVDALARVRRSVPGAELRIYGDATRFLDVVMEAVRRQGLLDAVRYFGGKRPEDIVAAIDECDVGIIPNRRSIFTEINTPTRIFEYLSRGKPVITGRAQGVLDYFAEDALFFFELGDADDLARTITHVFAHPDEAIHVVKRGQQVYLAHRWREERRGLINRVAELVGPTRGAGSPV